MDTEQSGSRLNIEAVFPMYGDSHVKEKTVVRPSVLWNGDTYTLYLDSLQTTTNGQNAKQQHARAFFAALFINIAQLYFLGHDLSHHHCGCFHCPNPAIMATGEIAPRSRPHHQNHARWLMSMHKQSLGDGRCLQIDERLWTVFFHPVCGSVTHMCAKLMTGVHKPLFLFWRCLLNHTKISLGYLFTYI